MSGRGSDNVAVRGVDGRKLDGANWAMHAVSSNGCRIGESSRVSDRR